MKGTIMRGFFYSILLISATVLLLTYPFESSSAAKEGLQLCFDVIIPSLFPFFVLSSLIVSLGLAALPGKLLEHCMRPVFGVSGSCTSALILGAIGGYPVGIRTASQLCQSGQCSKEDATRLSAFCNNCGPAFLLGVAGIGVFSSQTVGFLLLGTHLTASLCVGILFRFFHPSKKVSKTAPHHSFSLSSFGDVFPNCVRDAFSSTLNVCAFVILFSVIIRLADCSGLLIHAAKGISDLCPFSSDLCRSFLIGIFEISTGICSLQDLTNSTAALSLAAFLLGWGGLSVHFQSLPYLHQCGISPKPYFGGKLLQGILACLFTALLAPFFLQSKAAMAVDTVIRTFPVSSLLQQEFFALWVLSGFFFLYHLRKKYRKRRPPAV